jgi:hypothetical protein
MNPDNLTAVGIFIAAQTIAATAAFFTMRADVKNLKGWVKDIAADTKSTALLVASITGHPMTRHEHAEE